MKLLYKDVASSILNIETDKRTDIYKWGEDNLLPSLVDFFALKSVTARKCIKQVYKAIYGGGLTPEILNIKVNTKANLNEVLRGAARELAKHRNVFFHVTYNANYEINSITVLPCTDVRAYKQDDSGYYSKYIYYDNFDKQREKKINKKDFKYIDIFNPEKEVVKKQIEKAGGILKYKGQILHVKTDSELYSYSDLYAVIEEAYTEYNSAVFRCKGSSNAFLNNKIIAVSEFHDTDDKKGFVRDLQGIRGAENTGSLIVLEVDKGVGDEGVKVSEQISVTDLSDKIDDKILSYSESKAEANICKAFDVPVFLVSNNDTSLFGSSGELLKAAKKILYESVEEERQILEEAFNLMLSHSKFSINNLKILDYGYKEIDNGTGV